MSRPRDAAARARRAWVTAMREHGNDRPDVPERAVVMGAGGFVGKAIACRLERDGVLTHASLAARSTSWRRWHRQARRAVAPWGSACRGFGFGSLPQRRDAAGQYHYVAAMLNAAAAEPLAFVVNISSDAVYADSAAPLSEASVKTPHRCTE